MQLGGYILSLALVASQAGNFAAGYGGKWCEFEYGISIKRGKEGSITCDNNEVLVNCGMDCTLTLENGQPLPTHCVPKLVGKSPKRGYKKCNECESLERTP